MGYNMSGFGGPSDEFVQYYAKLFGGRLQIVPPGSNPFDALDQFGYFIFEKGGIWRKVLISDYIWSQGFDGIDDIVKGARDVWFDQDAWIWQQDWVETRFDSTYKNPNDPEPEMTERVQRWQTFFGV